MTKSHVFLFGTLLFSLSTLPGLSESTVTMSRSLASQSGRDCNNLPKDLRNADEVTCEIVEKLANGQEVRGRVVVRKAKRAQQPELVWMAPEPDPNTPVVEENYADIEIQTETECTTGCQNGVRTGSPVYESIPVRDVKDVLKITDVVKKKYRTAANELIAQGRVEAERQEQIKRCEIDEQGREIPENRRFKCHLTQFNNLPDEEREEYFDQYVKSGLQDMIGSDSAARRNQGMQMVEKLARTLGPSEYLKESLTNLHRFGKAHQVADSLTRLPQNDPRRYQVIQHLAKEQQYFQAQGMNLNAQYAGMFTDFQVEALTQDFMRYQESLAQITSQHQQMLNPSPVTNSPYGNPVVGGQTGRNNMGQPGSYYKGGPASSAPGTRPPSPAWPSQQQQAPRANVPSANRPAPMAPGVPNSNYMGRPGLNGPPIIGSPVR